MYFHCLPTLLERCSGLDGASLRDSLGTSLSAWGEWRLAYGDWLYLMNKDADLGFEKLLKVFVNLVLEIQFA